MKHPLTIGDLEDDLPTLRLMVAQWSYPDDVAAAKQRAHGMPVYRDLDGLAGRKPLERCHSAVP